MFIQTIENKVLFVEDFMSLQPWELCQPPFSFINTSEKSENVKYSDHGIMASEFLPGIPDFKFAEKFL